MRTLILLTTRNNKDGVLSQLVRLRQLYLDHPEIACLVIEDAGADMTFDEVSRFLREHPWPSCMVVRNRNPLGPGGNQKIGLCHAIEQGFDSVLVIADGGPSHLSATPRLLEQFQQDNRADYLLTTERFSWLFPFAWPRGLRLQMLSFIENQLSGARIPGWHGPMRIYRTSALREIAFELNTHEAHFHTEILLQLISASRRRSGNFNLELRSGPLPQMARVRSWQAIKAALKFRLQRYNLFYDFRYHPELVISGPKAQGSLTPHYTHKAKSDSPHSLVCRDDDLVPLNSKVLDLGCSSGYVAQYLTEKKGCSVIGIDILDPSQVMNGFEYHQLDLERDVDRICQIIDNGQFDVILILDVLEHLSEPELFLLALYRRRYRKHPTVIVSTANVGFIVVRLMLLCGYFNYGNKGILDITHKRLFTIRTFKNLLDQTGFAILRRCGFPLPWKELGLPAPLCRTLETIHGCLVRLWPTLFAYQVLYVTQPLMMPDRLIALESQMAGEGREKQLNLTLCGSENDLKSVE